MSFETSFMYICLWVVSTEVNILSFVTGIKKRLYPLWITYKSPSCFTKIHSSTLHMLSISLLKVNVKSSSWLYFLTTANSLRHAVSDCFAFPVSWSFVYAWSPAVSAWFTTTFPNNPPLLFVSWALAAIYDSRALSILVTNLALNDVFSIYCVFEKWVG